MSIEIRSAVRYESRRPCRARVARAIEDGDGRYLGRNNHQTFVMSVRKSEDEEIRTIILQDLVVRHNSHCRCHYSLAVGAF